GQLCILMTFLLHPLELVLTGDHQQLNGNQFAPIMLNHQIYSDWWYMIVLSWFRNAHGRFMFALKEDLLYAPVIGQSMWLMDFLFLSRKWQLDKPRIQKRLERAQKQNGLWYIIFPEGTVLCEETRGFAYKYRDKMDLDFEPRNVLIPKHAGLHLSLNMMQPKAEYLYDLTVGYSGVKPGEDAYDHYPVAQVFFRNQGPKQVNIHVRRYKISEIPGTDSLDDSAKEEFGKWLRQVFKEKDERLQEFYETGRFPDTADGVGFKQTLPVNEHAHSLLSLFGLIAASIVTGLVMMLV
ncbi:acyltransferase-domain-containing protein, partial [Gorgonomyces haynaldii]